MATSKGGTGKNQKDDDNNNNQSGQVMVEVEVNRRLLVGNVTYEETSVNGEGAIKVSGAGIDERELSDEEISGIVRFFVGFQRRRGRDDSVQDGRGQVTNPQSDARLKGNEDQRPTDPDRSKQAGRTK